MGWFDKALLTVAPGLAKQRMRDQLAAKYLSKQIRRYDGATKGRRSAGWGGVNTSANSETMGNAETLRNNARALERNNAWASRAIQVLVSNTIGTGIRCQPLGSNRRIVDQGAKLWKAWAETTACDFEGRHDLYGLQALILATVARDGEAIVRFRSTSTGPIPLSIQVLEPDFLDTRIRSGQGENPVIQGVEVDKDTGREVAYWLYEQHPGEYAQGFKWHLPYKSNRVPVDQVARIYRQDRAGQLRGVSWLASVMLPLHDLDDYEDAQLMRQKVAASFAAFVHDATGSEDLTGTGSDTELSEKIEPGIIEVLPPGKTISFSDPPALDGFSDFTRAILRKVAAGIGTTYEALTGDLSSTNFSSGRMGWIEFGRNIEAWRWRMIIPQFCDPTWAKFVQAAAIAGFDLSSISASWTAPRRELINPKDEQLAMRDAIRAGLISWSEAVRELGFDPEDLALELKADADRFDRLGLVLDSDPRRTTQQGMPRDKTTPDDPGKPAASDPAPSAKP